MKKPKMNIFDLAREMKNRGLTAQVFNNGIHWRIVENGIDLWPTTGRWKWMGTANSGTLEDFCVYLDSVAEKEALLLGVLVIKSK